MIAIQPCHIFLVNPSLSWSVDWVWGLALIVLTVLTVFGLSLIRERTVRAFNQIGQRHHPTVVFVTIVGAATLSATVLHAGEASVWASAYKFLGAKNRGRYFHYPKIRAHLKKTGAMIDANDLFIAAHVRCLGLTLVTNTGEFGSSILCVIHP
jgi:predicted nucleic acid-binding protein